MTAGGLRRRDLLRGLGLGGALWPAIVRAARAETPPPRRAAFLFYANGSHYAWAPAGEGAKFKLTPHLAPLEEVRSDVTILRNLSLARGRGNPHKAATLAALGAGAPTSFDQVLAASMRGQTPLPSLELAIGFTSGGGGVAPSLSQVDGVFLPGERNPFAAYRRIAARAAPGPDTADTASMDRLLAARRSVLDSARQDVQRFRARLSSAERAKADLYLESLRELEKSLSAAKAELRAPACAGMLPPADTADFVAHVADMPKVSRLFLDVLVMALACDVTRVVSMMWGGGESDEPAEFMGLRDWHITTHADPDGPGGAKVIAMQAYLMGELAYLLRRLKALSDGPGSLLDHSVVVVGTQNGNTNQTNFAKEDHDRRNTPFIVAGRLGGALRPGRLVDCQGANHNDLYLALAHGFGLPLKTVGEPEWCTGPLAGLG
jgi:hypothetical protein